jgi:hypothetical protein
MAHDTLGGRGSRHVDELAEFEERHKLKSEGCDSKTVTGRFRSRHRKSLEFYWRLWIRQRRSPTRRTRGRRDCRVQTRGMGMFEHHALEYESLNRGGLRLEHQRRAPGVETTTGEEYTIGLLQTMRWRTNYAWKVRYRTVGRGF